MFTSAQRRVVCLIVLVSLSFLLIDPASLKAARNFSVRDDIALTQFGDIYRVTRGDLVVSPSGRMVAVHTTRASLLDGKLHDQLRIYDIAKLRRFVNTPGLMQAPAPSWTVNESTAKSGQDQPLMTRIRWLRNETGVAFLLRTDQGEGLYMSLIDKGDPLRLSPAGRDVLSFDINDERHYVFTLVSQEAREESIREFDAPFRVGTRRRSFDAMFPQVTALFIGRGELWAASGGAPKPVRERTSGKPIILYEPGSDALALSPDGATVVTIRPEATVPSQWVARFPPPFPGSPYRLRAGAQNLDAASGAGYVGDYVRIDLASGAVTSLTNAPEAGRAGWWESIALPAWSDDGSSILLPGTFDRDHQREDSRPCVVVVRIKSGTTECAVPLKRNLGDGFEPGYERIDLAAFARGRDDQILLENSSNDSGHTVVRQYTRSQGDTWRLSGTGSGPEAKTAVEVKVRESFNEPPVLMATDPSSGKSRIVFDPNPGLKNLNLGEAELYRWTDHGRHEWEGILYKPVGYRSGTRYPLVIENHGFSIDRFIPSGGFPSAFVAEELASVGIMVLHVRDCATRSTPSEGPCNVHEYEAAVDKLTQDGLIDPSRVGIIGFSRTVFYVLEALTTSKMRFKAASITQGLTGGYMDYLSAIGPNDAYTRDAEALIGSAPYGPGLARWLKDSPDFNMENVATPLRVVAQGADGVLEMWEPYALLEKMRKPVDLIILNTHEHIITDPAVRLAAQEGNIDWMRYWLQGYEDPDPSKRAQYARWRKLSARGRDAISSDLEVQTPR